LKVTFRPRPSKRPNEVVLGALQIAAIEVVRTKVLVASAVADEQEGNFELLVSRGDAGLLGSALRGDALVERTQISVLGVGAASADWVRPRRIQRLPLRVRKDANRSDASVLPAALPCAVWGACYDIID